MVRGKALHDVQIRGMHSESIDSRAAAAVVITHESGRLVMHVLSMYVCVNMHMQIVFV